jgi:ribosome maturation factor RimP
MDQTRHIETLIQPAIGQLGYELVRVQMQGSRRQTLQIMAERSDRRGMTVDDCARISREVSALLDEADPIETDYVLEVSSPGIDRPLIRAADYDRFIGHEAKFELVAPVAGRKRFQGVIAGRDGDRIAVRVESETIEAPLADIKRARLVLTDRLIASVRAIEQEAGEQEADSENADEV